MKRKSFLSVLLAGIVGFVAQAEDFQGRLYIENATIAPDGKVTLSVQMENNLDICGFQFNVKLPEGISYVNWDISEERLPEGTTPSDAAIKGQKFENQILMCRATYDKTVHFLGNTGEIAKITIAADPAIIEGAYTVQVTDIDLSDTTGKDYDIENGLVDTSFTLNVQTPTYDDGYSVEVLPFAFTGDATVRKSIIMANKTAITDIAFDVEVPSYFTDNNLCLVSSVDEDKFWTNYEISSNVVHVTVEVDPNCSEGTENAIANFGIRRKSGATAGVYPITIKNIQMTDVDGKSYLAAPYTTEIFVGEAPKATVTDGVVTFHGNYGGATEFSLLKAALPTGATIDLTEVSAMAEDATALKTDNVIVTADAVAYGRTVSNAWGTLCLPFDIKTDDNIQLYEMTGASSTALSFEKVASVAANTPLVFKATGDGFTIKTANDGSFEVGAAASTKKVNLTPSVTNWVINGSYVDEPIDVSSLQAYALSGGEFHRVTSKINVKAFRAWFQNNGAPMGAAIRIEEGTDGIEFVEQEDGSVKLIYDMQGRMLKNGEHQQMYIENGKKVISINK